MKINIKSFVILITAGIMLFGFEACKRNEPHHPITQCEWIDATGTKLLRFSINGRYRDLYDYMHTRKDRYEVGEKMITVYHEFNDERDTSKMEIVKCDLKNLVLKHDNGSMDYLHPATKLQLLIGRWIPNFDESIADTFDIFKPEYDSKLYNFRGETRPFHYSVVNDTTLNLNFFNEGITEKVNYFISEDRTMLLLKYKNIRVSLVRY